MSPWTGRSGKRSPAGQALRARPRPGRWRQWFPWPGRSRRRRGWRRQRARPATAARQRAVRWRCAAAVRGEEFPDPGEQPARVHLVVGGNVEGAGDAGAQEGFAHACFPDGQRLHGQAGRLLDGPQVRERPAVGGVGAHGEGRRREVSGAGWLRRCRSPVSPAPAPQVRRRMPARGVRTRASAPGGLPPGSAVHSRGRACRRLPSWRRFRGRRRSGRRTGPSVVAAQAIPWPTTPPPITATS